MKATTNRCMKVIRDLADAGEPITSLALRDLLKIKPTEKSTALDIAAGWISTLRRYGFLKVVKGEKVQGPQRPVQVYMITEWGKRYKNAKQGERSMRIAANPSGKQG